MRKLLIAALLVSSMAHADVNFSVSQIENLNYAYQFGEQYTKDAQPKTHLNRYDNNGLGYIMAAIIWRETSAGSNMGPKDNHHAYGMFQNYLPTLRSRATQKGLNMSDRELIRHVQKRENSAAWAYEELQYWMSVHDGNTRKALAAYNAGRKWKLGLKYADDVLKKANYLKANKLLTVLEN
ncbi:hypothetical protein NCTGTJJY_CDS0118 [Serratia phage 92A1]|nr:hypothetical protein NCTGTJJY_CDS0118 [Serratia phage 92A1]